MRYNACGEPINLFHVLRLQEGKVEIRLSVDQWAAYRMLLLSVQFREVVVDLTPVVQDKNLPHGTAALFVDGIEVSRIEGLAIPYGFEEKEKQ